MAVPDTTTFTLQDVVTEVNPTTDDLVDCFADAIASKFDSAYSGSKNNLLNFRNYGAGSAAWVVGDITLAQSQTSTLYSGTSPAAGTVYVDQGGQRMFILDFPNKIIKQYSLSVANDITSTTTYINQQGFSYPTNFLEYQFDQTGLKVFILSYDGNIYEHIINGNPWDISKMDPNISGQYPVPGDIPAQTSFAFRNDGLQLFFSYNVGGLNYNAIHNLGANWELGTIGGPTIADVSATLPTQLWGTCYIYESSGTHDHWIVAEAGGAPFTVDFKDGITNSDVGSTSANVQIQYPIFTSINDDYIFQAERTGSSPNFVYVLIRYDTNV